MQKADLDPGIVVAVGSRVKNQAKSSQTITPYFFPSNVALSGQSWSHLNVPCGCWQYYRYSCCSHVSHHHYRRLAIQPEWWMFARPTTHLSCQRKKGPSILAKWSVAYQQVSFGGDTSVAGSTRTLWLMYPSISQSVSIGRKKDLAPSCQFQYERMFVWTSFAFAWNRIPSLVVPKWSWERKESSYY